jgi:hypothetical protein
VIKLGAEEKTSFVDYLWAFTKRWFTAMSGPLSVPAAIAGAWVENPTTRILLGLTAIGCFFFSSYWVWATERRRRLEAEAKLANHLRLVFKKIHFDENGPTEFHIDLEIWNPAHATILRNWWLTVKRDGKEVLVQAPRVVFGGRVLPDPIRGIVRDDFSSNPIESGTYREAHLTFTVDQEKRRELEAVGTHYAISVNDVTGAMLVAEHVI